jgi:iron(III) transport system substrate-binding protein
MVSFRRSIVLVLALLLGIAALPANAQEGVLTVYSGRGESLIAPLIAQFTEETGIQVQVLYGDTAALASQILEEGANSPADVFFGQDAGALGALAKAGLLATLPSDITERVSEAAFKSPDNLWVGISARARVLVYNTELVSADELPASILDLTGEQWRGRVGWAPTNASFQANVTAMRLLLGDEATLAWLEGMVANDTVAYSGNTGLVQAVINGEVAVGLANHYYIYRFYAENPNTPAALHYFPAGDVGALINIAGAGILKTSDQPGLAQRFLLYLLGNSAQTYFAQKTYEYPLVASVPPSVDLRPLADIQTPDIDLSDLSDLQATLDLIEQSGALD